MSEELYQSTGVRDVRILVSRASSVQEYTLDDLAKNDQLLAYRNFVLAITTDENSSGSKKKSKKKLENVQVVHRAAGRDLPETAVKARSGGRYEIQQLFRGRNDLTVTVEGAKEPLVIPVYYKGTLIEWVDSFLKAFILVVILKTFVIQAFFIPTGSMRDTLLPSDYILVEKVSGLFSRPKRGDVIVFQYPEDPTKDFIKRKAADQGEKVRMQAKQLYLDGKCLDESSYVVHKDRHIYIDPTLSPQGYLRDNFPETEIPPGHNLALGDNRDNSQDSRFWGTLPDYRLKGRALLTYWPFRRMGWIRPQVGVPHEQCPPLPGPTRPTP